MSKYPQLLSHFLDYVRINTRSDEYADRIPSTQSQIDFALNVLKPTMEFIGLEDVHYLDNGFIVGTLPANSDKFPYKIGFISHMDTADFNADNVRPQVVENYQGGSIPLGDSGYELNPNQFPQLQNYLGQTLITTDGHTLLGADDKAGIAEILSAVEYLIAHPEIEHAELRIGFGPDEEIGTGADRFDAADFNVDFAYTVDGGPLGELQYETFNAALAHITFKGRNVHPGTAKDQMINALQLAMDFHSVVPDAERPEYTEGYQGFYHLQKLSGTEEEAHADYILRDFESQGLTDRKETLQRITGRMNRSWGEERVCVAIKDQYSNMKEVIEKDMRPVLLAEQVMKSLDITPIIEPIRGGTDGSKISFMGIPTPNIFAGGENMHGRYEFVSLQTMEKACDVIIGIASQELSLPPKP